MMFAPPALRDPQLLMNIVVQEREQMMQVVDRTRVVYTKDFLDSDFTTQQTETSSSYSPSNFEYESDFSETTHSSKQSSPSPLLSKNCICPELLSLSTSGN
jgi:hypothetical protein